MTAKKSRLAPKRFVRDAANYGLGAARVGDQSAGPRSRCDGGKRIDCGADGKRDVDKVRAANGTRDVVRGFMHYATLDGAFEHGRAIKSDHGHVWKVIAHCERERAAN